VIVGIELVAAVIAASTFGPGALRALRHRRIGVGTLMTIAAVGAVALGQVAEAALLGILFSIAEGLEHHAVTRTRRRLRALLGLVPPAALVLRHGRETTVSPDDLVVGDVLVLRPGERSATDGRIRSGRTSLDTTAITGESVPIEAEPGNALPAGVINGGSAVEVEVTALAADSSLARIVHVVEDAQERKGAAQRLADRVARPLVPSIMDLAALVAGGRRPARRPGGLDRTRPGRDRRRLAVRTRDLGPADRGRRDRGGQPARRPDQGRRRGGGARPGPGDRVGQDRHPDPQPA
jgi:cation-transporting ATPase G